MMWAFIIALALCGALDYKYREIPLWSILLVNILGIGMCALHHPFLSALAAVTVLIFCLRVRMGAADKLIFPIVAGCFGLGGVLLVMFTVIISLLMVRKSRGASIPAVAILSLFVIISVGGGII
ncbi:hypothetical protein [Paenibacillus sp. 1A_MP2]|uniref:hypothetical protein n=1 Tax=Paenibacillus sp. 1A_MP2 TaxID=3457495 RepID=UPI003FCCD7CB